MRKLELLILASRRATENQEFTDTAGIQNEEFIQYFNDGQEEIHSKLNALFPHILMAQKVVQLVQGQEGYTIPSDVYLGTRIDMIEFSPTGLSQDYYSIKKGSLKERLNGSETNPSFYIRNGNQILLQPAPQSGSGTIRISYQKAIPRLDIKRATVETVTLGAGNTITTLILDDALLFDRDALLEEGYISITDKDGVVKMESIPIDDISTTGVVTISAGFTYQPGETIAVGDTVLRGKKSTQVSQLPDVCEKYLLEYCNARILVRDSSSDSAAVGQVLIRVEGTLQTAFAEPDNDPDYVPVLDAQYLGWDSF